MAENRFGGDAAERLTVTRSDLDGMSLCVAVPAAVAARTDANVLDLDPLSGVVDVDVIDEVWGSAESGRWNADARVTFPYMGYEVSVTADELRVKPLDGDTVADGADQGPASAED